jgi:peptide/nickel transport system permease protein
MANKPANGAITTKKRPLWIDTIIRLFREKPLGAFGAIVTILLILTGIFAGVVAPHGYNEGFPEARLAAPSLRFPLGTDHLGRDVLSRVIYGARISTIVGFSATSIATLISVFLGILSGYLGGKFDLWFQRFVDAWMCIPGLIFAMIIISIVGPGMGKLSLVLGVVWGVGGSRIIRGAVIAIKENVYIGASRAIGCSVPRILWRHVLPNVLAPAIILFTTRVPNVILTEATLSFLGQGLPPPLPSWGGMLSGSGRSYMFQAPWMVLWPGVALSVVVYGVNMFGDALRDLLDPRLKGGTGRYGGKSEVGIRKEGASNAQDPADAAAPSSAQGVRAGTSAPS